MATCLKNDRLSLKSCSKTEQIKRFSHCKSIKIIYLYGRGNKESDFKPAKKIDIIFLGGSFGMGEGNGPIKESKISRLWELLFGIIPRAESHTQINSLP